ncbi:Signal-transduction histidine kinase senX3 [Clostridiales bacterium CHKCI001]|nr:Signal-transduction histidine kinase senX3 [Clostridiales bacterium CHKCI001]
MKHSIRVKIVSICVGVLVITLLCLWGLNTFFLEDYYCTKKTEAFIMSYNEIDKMLTQKTNITRVDRTLQKIRDTNNIAFLRVDNEGWNLQQYTTSPSETKMLLERLQANQFGLISEKEVKVLYQQNNYKIQKYFDYDTNSYYLECFGLFSDTSSFIMFTPLESIKDSVEISNQFLLQVGIVLLLLSAIAIYAVTTKMTSPILTLANISNRMAHLDFDARYEGNEDDELGVLGKSINDMSQQLERTISELQKANLQLKKDIEEKIQIDEMRKEFLSNVSHELKTPIALIQGYAEGLQELADDPESRDYYTEVIIDEAGKMNRMVKKLLTLNHIEFGQEELIMEEFNIIELVKSVVDASKIMIEQKQVQVEMLTPETVTVIGDEFKIEEVVTNYISNALNHIDYDRKITIWTEDKGEKVRILVHNTGDPIPTEDLEKVWIKFFKVDKARTRAYGGSGIGLSIVKAIMDSMGQQVGVRNENGGVTFWFEMQKKK